MSSLDDDAKYEELRRGTGEIRVHILEGRCFLDTLTIALTPKQKVT